MFMIRLYCCSKEEIYGKITVNFPLAEITTQTKYFIWSYKTYHSLYIKIFSSSHFKRIEVPTTHRKKKTINKTIGRL